MKSMRTSINRLLARGTGPMRLRSELSQKTKPMSTLLGKIDLASAVRAEVPQSVLGGDILALMSEQLREAIQYSGQDESATDDTPRSQFRLEPQPGSIAGRAEAGTSPQLSPAERPADPFPELRSQSRKQEMEFPTSAPDVASAERWTSPLPRDAKTVHSAPESEKAAYRDQPSAIVKSDANAEKPVAGEQKDMTTFARELQEYRQLTQQEHDAAPGREDLFPSTGRTDSVEGSESQNVTPVLVEKLREYWRLSHTESPSEKVSAYPGNPIIDRDNAASFPALPRHTLAPGSWPEMTGRQVAEKIDSFISGRDTPGLARSVRQVIQSDLPEKVEIQNVFNIQVRSEEKSRDLSEKIADILHEQALQHGIDVT